MLRAIFVLMILLPGLLLAIRSRFWGLLLYLWNAFFRPQDFMWMRTSNLRLSLILGLVFVVPALLSGTLPNLTHPLSIGTLLFLMTGLVAQTNAIDQVVGWRWIDAQSRLTVVLLLAVTLMRTPTDLLRVLAVPALSFGFYATKAGLGSLLGGGVQYAEGLEGTFTDNNGYALATVMTIPLLVALAQNLKLVCQGLPIPSSLLRWISIGLYVAVPLCIYTVVSTFSRGGFLGMMAAALAYVAFHPRRLRMLFALALVGSLAFVVPLPRGYLERIATISELQEDADTPQEDVTEGRLYMWGLALDMVREQPLGIGMRNFASLFNLYDEMRGAYGRRRDVHSSHFQVLVEHGYFGAAVWIFQFAFAYHVGMRVRKRSLTPGLSPEIKKFLETVPTALMVSMSGFLIGGATISAALNELTWLTFAVFASLDRMSKRLCAEATEPQSVKPAAVRYRMPAAAVARAPLTGAGSAGVGLRFHGRQK